MVSVMCKLFFRATKQSLTPVSVLSSMDSRLGTNDRIKDWIPACAESTPRIEKKCSGGNDRPKEGPLVARGPLCSYASTVCVVTRLREQVRNGDDMVNRIPSHIATE